MSDQNNENGREEQRTRSFNPNEHIMKLKSKDGVKDYLPVQFRLVWFREQCPGGTVDTEEIQVDLDREVSMEVSAWNNETRRSEKVVKMAKGYARFRAVVTDGKGGRATGTKSESAVNFADYIEKAETGAIGRALAALGYGTQFTGDELDEGVTRLADAPVKSTDQALHDLAKPGSYEQHEAQANGHQDADKSTVAVTRGDLYTRGEEKGLWSRTSPDKFYAWASSIAARPQSKNAWDMTVSEMGEMAKRIYAEPEVKKASAGVGK